MLSRKAQQILNDAVRSLGLLIELLGVFDSLRAHLAAGDEQLAVAEDGRERVVELVRHAGNQLSDSRHLLAVQELLLRATQVVVGLPGLLVECGAFDGAGELAADGDQQVNVSRRELLWRSAPNRQASDNVVLRPEDHDIGGQEFFFSLRLAKNCRQRQSLHRKKRRVDRLDMLKQIR